MQSHRPTLHSLVDQACDMVHRDQFTQTMITVNLVYKPVTENEAASNAPVKPSQSTKYAQVSKGNGHQREI